MDKSKFTRDPHLDSEGFPWDVEAMQTASSWLQMHNQLHRQAADRFNIEEDQRMNALLANAVLAAEFGCNTKEIGGRWTCTDCGYQWSAMIDDADVPEYHACNPKGWQEVDGVTLPSVNSWAEERPTDFDYSVQAKKALAEFFLNGPVQTFDGEAGTYSDPKCAKCSPWARLEQRDLDTIHQLWLAERITPNNGGTR